MIKRRLAALLVFSVMCIVIVVAGLRNSRITDEETNLFDAPSCTMACLLGFEPFASERSEVEDWLNDSQISYTIESMGITNNAIIIDPNDSMSVTEHLTERITLEFDQEGTLWRIFLSNPNLCLNSVIKMYGPPDLVDLGDQLHKIRLGYPDDGLLFALDLRDEIIIEGVFVTSSEWVEHFASLGQQTSWDEVQSRVGEPYCTDIYSEM
jgi:hypothetical protein